MGFHIYRHIVDLPACPAGRVVVIGNFDGVHLGHREVLAQARAHAHEGGHALCVLTFEPHPRTVLGVGPAATRLTPFAQKMRLLKAQDVDEVAVIRFSKAFSQTTPTSFVEDTLVTALNAKHVVVGEGFKFGAKRAGDTTFLAEKGRTHGFDVHTVVPTQYDGETVSSSRIRALLEVGDVQAASALIGRPFRVDVGMFEDDMVNLVGDAHRYTPLKNAVYWAKIGYNGASGKEVATIPLTVMRGKVVIPPMENLPDIPEGHMEIHFLDRIQTP